MVAKGESDGRHSFQASLYHNAHRTGIMQVYRRIVAVVDAAYHQVGLAVEHRMKSQLHTIGRRTGTLVYRQPNILTDQLVVDRFRYSQRTRKGADTKPFAVDGLRNAEWVAMDYSDILVHVFLPETREFYNLEHLWADAKLTQIPDLD